MIGAQEGLWKSVADETSVTPLEAKAIYVVGMFRHLVESAGLCLSESHHLATYLLAMDAVELFGAVVHGRKDDPDVVAAAGLGYLIGTSKNVSPDSTFDTTSHGTYTVRDCINRRHFAAHGGHSFGTGIVFDPELTVRLLCRLVAAIDRWWDSLRQDRGARQLLGNADVVPLATAGSVLFVTDLLGPLMQGGGSPGGQLRHEEAWRPACA
jgi:hypothetical protein